jgi:microcystin-dependent protein
MNNTKGKIVNRISAALTSITVIAASPLLACSSDPFVGSVCITAATFCPSPTYTEANGQLLPITQYQTLYSLLGTTYGGNGTTNFAVPDMRGRTPVGVGTGTRLQAVHNGEKRGLDFMILNIAQMPTHSHTGSFTPDGAGASASVQASTKVATKPQVADGDYIASNAPTSRNMKFISGADAGTTATLGGVSGGGGSGTVQVGEAGGSKPFANYPPQQALKYCIAVEGLYPSRP